MGYRLIPCARPKVSKWRDYRKLFSAVYTIDTDGRRYVPMRYTSARNKHLLMFGCSFAFGEGLNDNQTLAYHLARESSEHVPYVYATGGYGPAHMLLQLRQGDLAAEVSERAGLAIYLYVDVQMERLLGRSWLVNHYGREFPYFRIEDGDLVHLGNFEMDRPWTSGFYHLLGRSYTYRLAEAAVGLQFPLRTITRDSVDLFTRVVEEAAKEYTASFPEGRFAVAFYPGSMHAEALRPRLLRDGIECMDYSSLWPSDSSSHRLPDGHPNERANVELAAIIARDLLVIDPTSSRVSSAGKPSANEVSQRK